VEEGLPEAVFAEPRTEALQSFLSHVLTSNLVPQMQGAAIAVFSGVR
jgi:ABC-type histidine transport system ATPase subunit